MGVDRRNNHPHRRHPQCPYGIACHTAHGSSLPGLFTKSRWTPLWGVKALSFQEIPHSLMEQGFESYLTERTHQLVLESQLHHKICSLWSTITIQGIEMTILWAS
jgi:hypothetical protein